MDGAASEAVRGLKAEQDTDLALIWEALARRFGFVDEPHRAMRSFYVRKQPEGETSVFSSKACGCSIVKVGRKPTSSRPEADSLLRRKFVDGIMDMELQRHLRVHAAKDDFATTVSKARQFLDASELTRTVKKPAIRAASSNVNYQTLVDSFIEALERRDQGRMIEVNTAHASNSTASTRNRNKKAPPRKGSSAPSNSSARSSSSRASSTGRTARFQDQADTRSSNQGYGSSARSRWQGKQSPQGNTNGPLSWVNRRPPGQETPRFQPPRRDGRHARVDHRSPATVRRPTDVRARGPTFPSPAQGNAGNWEAWMEVIIR